MQREEKHLEASLDAMIQRVQDLNNSIGSFLFKLEHEYETINWPTMLDNFALMSGQLNTLNRLLKGDKIPNLKNLVLLPLALAPQRDPALEKLTEGRVLFFNHETVPDYLRTKPEPEVEEKIMRLMGKSHQASTEAMQKQINQLNKISVNMVEQITNARAESESELSQKSQPQTTSQQDTNLLIAAVSFGKNLKANRRAEPTPQQSAVSQDQRAQSGMQASKAPSTIKTNIKSASNVHPYSRP